MNSLKKTFLTLALLALSTGVYAAADPAGAKSATEPVAEKKAAPAATPAPKAEAAPVTAPAPKDAAPAAAVTATAININTASAEEIAAGLDGVGEKKAADIVADRTANGAFNSVDDLMRVKGIGQATVDKNRDKIKVK